MVVTTEYGRLAQRLLEDIVDGRYEVGDKLPTEAELCSSTGLARGTVRQALQQLQRLGMIDRQPRHGSRVIAKVPVGDYQPVAGSADDIITIVQRTRIVHPLVRDVRADRALGRRLGVRAGSAWHLIEGPRVMRGERRPPLCWSEQYVTTAGGLDAVLRGDFTLEDTASVEIEQIVRAEPLDPAWAVALETDCATALVVLRRQRDLRGRLVSVGVHTHPADRYEIRTVIAPREVSIRLDK
jgi:DNA-binding GntR family transcriptional regulator